MLCYSLLLTLLLTPPTFGGLVNQNKAHSATYELNDPSNYIYEDEVRDILEKLRELLKNGIEGEGIQPMDPLELKRVPFDFYLMDTECKGFIQDTFIRNHSDFQVEHLKITILPRKKIQLKLGFNELNASGYYKVIGTLFGELPINGQGKYSISLKDLTLSLAARVIFKKEVPLQIQDLDVSYTVGGASVRYQNILEDEEEKEIEEELILRALDRIGEDYMPHLINTLKVLLNDFMVKIQSI